MFFLFLFLVYLFNKLFHFDILTRVYPGIENPILINLFLFTYTSNLYFNKKNLVNYIIGTFYLLISFVGVVLKVFIVISLDAINI